MQGRRGGRLPPVTSGVRLLPWTARALVASELLGAYLDSADDRRTIRL